MKKTLILMALILAIGVNIAYAAVTLNIGNNTIINGTTNLNLSTETFSELNMTNVTFCWRDLNPTSSYYIIGSEVNGTGAMDSVQLTWDTTAALNDSSFGIVDGLGSLKAVVHNSTAGVSDPCSGETGDANWVSFDLTQQIALNNTALTSTCSVPQDNTRYGTNGSFQVDCRVSEETNETSQIVIGTGTYSLTANTSNSGYVRSFNVLTDIAEGTYSYSFTSSDLADGGDVQVEGTFMVDEKAGGSGSVAQLLTDQEQEQPTTGIFSIFGSAEGNNSNLVILIVIGVVIYLIVKKK